MDAVNATVLQVARSVARGAGLGLFLAGLCVIGWATFSSRHIPCTDLSPQECGLAREVAHAERVRQIWMGTALVLLGGGIVFGLQLYFRSQNTAPRR